MGRPEQPYQQTSQTPSFFLEDKIKLDTGSWLEILKASMQVRRQYGFLQNILSCSESGENPHTCAWKSTICAVVIQRKFVLHWFFQIPHCLGTERGEFTCSVLSDECILFIKMAIELLCIILSTTTKIENAISEYKSDPLHLLILLWLSQWLSCLVGFQTEKPA